MTKFIIYLFGYDQAQTVTTKPFDEEHWYMASDICRLLGIVGYSAAVHSHLDEEEYRKETTYIGGRRGKKHVLLINNIGVLKLINVAKGEDTDTLQEKAQNIPKWCLPENQHHLLKKAS